MSRLMNQTYFEWYEFDANAVRILIANNVVVLTNESEYKVKFQYYCGTYIQNFLNAYE